MDEPKLVPLEEILDNTASDCSAEDRDRLAVGLASLIKHARVVRTHKEDKPGT